ncbi:MAG: calcium-binding protein [Pseudomonadota bacterium]
MTKLILGDFTDLQADMTDFQFPDFANAPDSFTFPGRGTRSNPIFDINPGSGLDRIEIGFEEDPIEGDPAEINILTGDDFETTGSGSDRTPSAGTLDRYKIQTETSPGVFETTVTFKNLNWDLIEVADAGGTESSADDQALLESQLTGADKIIGSLGDDTLIGLAGEDTIKGRDGDDRIQGGGDADTLRGDAGDDTLQGGGGADNIAGGADSDSLVGAAGDDTLNGSGGSDELQGDEGDDQLVGGGGQDSLDGGADNDRMFGGAGRDFLAGDVGDDLLRGNDGQDLLIGEAGDDTLQGDAGADGFVFLQSDGAGRDQIKDFEIGTDQVFLSDYGLSGFGDLNITYSNGRATVTLDGFNGVVIKFDSIAENALSASDFDFTTVLD